MESPTRHPARHALFALALTAAQGLHGQAVGLPFDQAVFKEVVRTVEVVAVPALSKSPAAVGGAFRAPDLVQTGRRSRAQLALPDGTVTRIGSNTTVSFVPNSRTVNLQKGGLLLHTPSGRGGAKIQTAAATAAVVGTTIMVAATPDGGFKILTIEGVAEVNFAGAGLRRLNAGEMLFVLPGVAPRGRPGPAAPPPGKPSQTLKFDLERQVDGASLINGFQEPLPSIDQVNAAVGVQRQAIKSGKLASTDLLIVGSDTVVDTGLVERAVENQIDPRLARALQSQVDLDTPDLPPENVFRGVGPLPPALAALLGSSSLTGFVSHGAFITSPTIDFSPGDGAAALDFVAVGRVAVIGGTTFVGFDHTRRFRLTTAMLNFSGPGSNLTAEFAPGAVDGAFDIFVANDLALNGADIEAIEGHVLLGVRGDLTTTGGALRSLGGLAPSVSVFSDGVVSLSGTMIDAAGISLAARTIDLAGINFPGGSLVNLSSQMGMLAPAPNTGAPSQPGYVNFITGVDYGNLPAQDFVPVSQGGNGPALSPIQITPLN